ncbi:MAG: Ig-like domain-containing protein, partial [Thermoplasmata archaeon]|nr:Ig-like domain-containing protein [Thermoplasmata archaeon]
MRASSIAIIITLMLILAPGSTVGLRSGGLSSGPIDAPCLLMMYGPNGRFDINDTLTIDLLVYFKGLPADPDDLSLHVKKGEVRDLELERVEKGVFYSCLTITEVDANNSDSVWIKAYGNYSSERLSESLFIRLKSDYTFDWELVVPDPADHSPVPGQTVEYEVWFTEDGKPYNMTGKDFYVTLSLDGHGGSRLNITQLDVGRYSGNFTVADDLTTNAFYWVAVNVPDPGGGTWVSDEVVSRVTFFDVFIHALDINETRSRVQVYVTDKDGTPLQGATVNLSDTSGRYDPSQVWTAVTGRDGKADLIVPYDYMIWGNVSYNGYFHNVMGYQHLPPEGLIEVSPGNGWIPELTTQVPMPSGEEVVLEYILRDGYVPVVGKEMYFYIFDDDGMYWTGPVTTDSEGRFNITVTTPDLTKTNQRTASIYAYFHTDKEGSWYQRFHIYDIVNEDYVEPPEEYPYNLTHDPMIPGKTIQVNMTSDWADGKDEKACIRWGFGTDPDLLEDHLIEKRLQREPGLHEGEWSTLYEGCICGWGAYIPPDFVVPCTWDNSTNTYRANITVPSFISLGTDMYVKGELIELYPSDEPEPEPEPEP